MPLELVNPGDSTATVKAKMNAMFAEVGLPISDNTTEATNTFNELVSGYLDDPLPGLADRMNGVMARGRINAAVDALNTGGGGMLNAMSALKAKMMAGQNATGLFISDSTGNALDEWIYLFLVALAYLFPAYTIRYHLYAGGTMAGAFAYDAPITISTGTTGAVLDVYNAAVANTTPSWFMGGASCFCH